MVAIFKVLWMLIKAICNKKSEYIISFKREDDGKWYADIPGWPKRFHKNAEMVCGADRLLDALSGRKVGWENPSDYLTIRVTVKEKLDIKNQPKSNGLLCLEFSELTKGAFYASNHIHDFVYLCPVTLFVLGRYPRLIYYKVIDRKPKKEKEN